MCKSSFSRLMLVLVITGILTIFSGCDGNTQPPTSTPIPTSMTSTPTSIPAVTVTLTNSATAMPPKIAVLSPKEGDQVSLRNIVEGNSTGIYATDFSIYVLVYPIEVGQWYVQPEVDISSNGDWNTNAYFGDPANPSKDTGKKFRISVIVTSVKLKEGMQLEKIPDNVYRVDIKEVVRK